MTNDNRPASLDLVLRQNEQTLNATGVLSGDGNLVMSGLLGESSDTSLAIPLALLVEDEQVEPLVFADLGNRLQTFDPEGRQAGLYITDYTATPIIGTQYEVYTGVLHGEHDIATHFIATTDPFPLPFIAGAVFIGACAAGSGIAWLADFIQAHTNDWYADCRQKGGYPSVTPVFRPVLDIRHLDLHCEVRPEWKCRGSDGSIIAHQVGDFKPVHD